LHGNVFGSRRTVQSILFNWIKNKQNIIIVREAKQNAKMYNLYSQQSEEDKNRKKLNPYSISKTVKTLKSKYVSVWLLIFL